MSRPLRMLAVFAGLFAALLLASCSKPDSGYQGWIEANLIFVAPDESRVGPPSAAAPGR
jgi:hypothetical protein